MATAKNDTKTTTFTLPNGAKVTCSEGLARKIQGSATAAKSSK